MENDSWAVKNGMPLKTAAAQYVIAMSILRYYGNARTCEKNVGRPSLLTPEGDTGLFHRIFLIAEVGMPIVI
jgi:hypothetical protein